MIAESRWNGLLYHFFVCRIQLYRVLRILCICIEWVACNVYIHRYTQYVHILVGTIGGNLIFCLVEQQCQHMHSAHRNKDIKHEGSQILQRHLCILIPWNCRSPLWVTEMRDMRQVWALVHISRHVSRSPYHFLRKKLARTTAATATQPTVAPATVAQQQISGGSMILLKVTHSITLSYIIITSPSVGFVWISPLGLPRTHRFWTLISHL